MTKVWPWKRREVSGGMKYLVTAFDDDGFEFYNNYHSYPVLYSYVVMKCREYVNPRVIVQHGIRAHAFSLKTCLEHYLKQTLPDGKYLVMVPSSDKVRNAFWKTKDGSVEISKDPRSDCYAADIGEFRGDFAGMILEIRREFPGRYFKVISDNGFIDIEEVTGEAHLVW